MLLVKESCALRTRENEVEVDEEAEPGVERHPREDEVKGVLNDGEAAQDDEVDQPGSDESWIGGVEGFVGGEYGEQDGRSDAVKNELAMFPEYNAPPICGSTVALVENCWELAAREWRLKLSR